MRAPTAWILYANFVSEMMRPTPEPRVARFLDRTAAEGIGLAGRRDACSVIMRSMAMTVREMIELLERYPSDIRVVVSGYEEGYDDLSPKQISVVDLCLNTGVREWQGRHSHPLDLSGGPPDDADIVPALALHRVSH